MKKLRVLVFALGLALPLLGSAAVERYADPDRSVVKDGTQHAGWCWICTPFGCIWMPC